jgi:hypothetical protein
LSFFFVFFYLAEVVKWDMETAGTSSTSESYPVDVAAKVQQMPEYLVVCGWRSIKEVSLLLGQLVSTIPLQSSSDVTESQMDSRMKVEPTGLLTTEQVFLGWHATASALATKPSGKIVTVEL